jgi:hypothetical protein
MYTVDWSSISEVDREYSYTALLGYVRLRNFRIMPVFLYYSLRIVRQLQRTPGLVGYCSAAQISTREFYHLTAWETAAALDRFVRAQPHFGIMNKLIHRLGQVEFRSWSVPGSELPLVLKTELRRLRGTS